MAISPDARDVLRREAREVIASWRADGRFEPRCDSWIRGFDPEISREIARQGWIGMTWPTEHGGGGRSNLDRLVVTEELLAAGAPVAAHWFADRQIGPALLRHGSHELQDEFLGPIMRAEAFFAIGMSETEAGSDLAAVRTTATRDGDGWRMSGSKIWTSHAHRATHVYVLARTEPRGDDRHAGLSEFIVDLDAPGIEIRPILDLAGEHHFNEVRFDHAWVPGHRIIGAEGQGWRQVMEQLSFERGGPERFLSTLPLLDALLDHVRDHPTPDATVQIGVLLARLAALRHQAWEIAEAMDRGDAPEASAAALKVAGPRFEREVAATVRRLCPNEPAQRGAAGLRGHLAIATLAAPSFTLRGGSSDVLLSLIGKQVLR